MLKCIKLCKCLFKKPPPKYVMFKNLNKKKVLTMFIKYWFQYLLLSVFEDSIFIDFISNYNMCLRSRLEILSCKQIKP